MNVAKILANVNRIGKLLAILMVMVSFVGLVQGAGGGITALQAALGVICSTSKAFLGVAAMLLVVLGAITYASGQVMGAETRARATVWATAMFTGAIIGILIYVIIPPILAAILTGSSTTTGVGTATITC